MKTILEAHNALTLVVCAAFFTALFLLQPAVTKAQWTTPDGSGNISNTNSNNVGIGTTSPANKLEVSSAAPSIQMSDTGAGGVKLTMGSAGGFTGFGANRTITGSHYDTGKTTASYYMFVTNGNSIHVWGTTPTNNAEPIERMRLDKDGNFGIGTANPQDPLHLYSTANNVGTIRLQGGSANAGFVGYWNVSPMLLLSNNRHPGTNNNFNSGSAGSMILVGTASAPGDIGFYTTSTGVTPTYTEVVRMKAGGQVGIGTSSPGYRLDVQGGSINSSGGLCIAGDCKTAWSQLGSSQWTTSGTTINYSAGNVGIGITSPIYSLDVSGGVNSFRAKATTVSSSDAIATFENTSGIQMIVRGNGNVGIGTTSPGNKLHVAGSITVDGNINAKYQDVAEWVESSQELPAGTVVVLDSSKANQVIASTQSYDSRVAGVISLRPGLALGERGEGRVLVATTGRVKVRVDATNGPIQIGDLLVTGDKEGVAMKSVPLEIGGVRIHRPGTLIGKALEPLGAGSGEILVLLSLQ